MQKRPAAPGGEDEERCDACVPPSALPASPLAEAGERPFSPARVRPARGLGLGWPFLWSPLLRASSLLHGEAWALGLVLKEGRWGWRSGAQAGITARGAVLPLLHVEPGARYFASACLSPVLSKRNGLMGVEPS